MDFNPFRKVQCSCHHCWLHILYRSTIWVLGRRRG